jgi:tetratricopeptide (TPR) repeat protein
MGDSRDQKSFWVTLPGILTATAAVIGAITGLIGGLAAAGLIGSSQPVPASAPPMTTTNPTLAFESPTATPLSTATPTSEPPTATPPPTVTPNSTLADDLLQRGTTSFIQRQYQEALNYYQQALVIYQQVDNRRGEGNALHGIGASYHSLGQYDQALNYYQQALVIHREVGNRAGEQIICQTLAILRQPC